MDGNKEEEEKGDVCVCERERQREREGGGVCANVIYQRLQPSKKRRKEPHHDPEIRNFSQDTRKIS
jgi:hypothetical protein